MTQQRSERRQGRGLLRSWLRSALSLGAEAGIDPESCTTDPVAAADGSVDELPSAAVLPFPIRGEALLVRLAEQLRRHVGHGVGHGGPLREPFLFALSRQPQSRLTLDCQSYIEFVASRAEFRLAIDVAPNTSIAITTADFDSLVEFVVQYVSARLAETPALEAAS
jgi:hypothetical protein